MPRVSTRTGRQAALGLLEAAGVRDYARFVRSVGWLFRAGELRSEAALRMRRSSDALPPPWLLYLVQGNVSGQAFHSGGEQSVAYLRQVLARSGVGSSARMLDFGCGCGRLLRWWTDETTVYGCDYDPRLVSWCVDHLPGIPVARNDAFPPLRFEDDFFDVLYAHSVLTHLTPDVQLRWMREWVRVVRPGGLLVVTTHGPAHLWRPERLDEQRSELQAVGHLTKSGAGNLCTVWNTPEDVIGRLGIGLDLEHHGPWEMPVSHQNVWVFRVPSCSTATTAG